MPLVSAAPERVGMSSDRLGRIAPAMQRWIDGGTIAGASMMIARRNKIVYAQEMGLLDIEAGIAMPGDAIFRIFSMTKPIICTALMTFYEEGRFQLYTPVAKFIPALGGLKVWRGDGLPQEAPVRPITVGDLMKHTAGFTYDLLEDSPVGALYREAQLARNADRTLAEFVETLAELPLAYQPGARWHYSVAIDVAAHLLEILADKPLRDVLRERIFLPLGMTETDFCVPESKLIRLAAMYGAADFATVPELFAAWAAGKWGRLEAEDGYPTSKPQTFARGGHGLFSTTQDYMRFALMLANQGQLDGVRILSRKTVELMHTNHLPPAMLPIMLPDGVPISGYGFGLGSRVMVNLGQAGIPGSVDEFGWAGAASTYYWVDPAEEMVGVFMTQYRGMDEPDRDFRVLAYQAIVD
jgi:CubicO group peptidase (beta-lactamase class C family)